MSHLTEEQLILHYYGEEGETLAVENHLDDCEDCRAMYVSLQRVLNVVDSMPVPERGPEYGAQLWRRLESQLPVRRRFQWVFSPWRWAAAAAFAGLLAAAFLAGRYSPRRVEPAAQMASVPNDPQVRERILLVAVGDYLERSQMVLVELANADPKGGPLDISATQERASDLLTENRLYRQTADHTGDTAVSSVLDDLDRVLLEIAHAPSSLSPADLEEFRQRLKSEGILFKIRVLGSNVRNQEDSGAGIEVPATRQKL